MRPRTHVEALGLVALAVTALLVAGALILYPEADVWADWPLRLIFVLLTGPPLGTLLFVSADVSRGQLVGAFLLWCGADWVSGCMGFALPGRNPIFGYVLFALVHFWGCAGAACLLWRWKAARGHLWFFPCSVSLDAVLYLGVDSDLVTMTIVLCGMVARVLYMIQTGRTRLDSSWRPWARG